MSLVEPLLIDDRYDQQLFVQIKLAELKGHTMGKIFTRGGRYVFCTKCNANLFYTPNRGYGGTAEFSCNGR